MTLTYGGVPLRQSTPDLESWIDRNISPRDSFLQDVHYFPGPTLPSLPLAWIEEGRPWAINTLHWPRGASRWAFGFFLVEAAHLPAVMSAAFSSGYQTLPLVMSDGTNTLTTQMWLLPPRPLQDNQLYLLPLVDDRFFWWAQNTDSLAVTEGTTTWTTVLNSLASDVNETIVIDTINANYLGPAVFATSSYSAVPQALDLAARSIGHRIVRDLDGTVRSLNYTTSAARQTANITLGGNIAAGGKFLTAPLSTNSLNALVPQQAVFAFPLSNSGSVQEDGYVKTITLASLALPQFTGITGYNGEKTLRVGAIKTGSNQTTLDNHATQWATDWYLHALGNLDAAYNGLVPISPEGLSVRIEWSLRPDGCRTRLYRGGPETDEIPLPVATASGSVKTTLGPTVVNGPVYLNGPIIGGTSPGASTPPPGTVAIPIITGNGPPTYTPGTGIYPLVITKGDNKLWYYNGTTWVLVVTGGGGTGTGTDGQVWVTEGGTAQWEWLERVLATNVADTTVTTHGVDSTILTAASTPIAANTGQNGTIVRFAAGGYINTGGATTLTVKIKLNTTVILDGATTFSSTPLVNTFWFLTGQLTCKSTGVSGSFDGIAVLNTNVPAFFPFVIGNATGAVTVDTTIDETPDITVQWSTSGESFTTTTLLIERVH